MAKQRAKKPTRKAPRPTPKPASAATAIGRLDEAFMKAASAKDAAALVRAFYAPEAVLMPPNHPIVEGRKAIQNFLQGLMDGGFVGITLETTSVESAGRLAYGRGRYRLAMAPAGGEPVHETGKYIVAYSRQPNGAWRAVADIFNSDGPAAP
jgi:ketosteroid isomerase-like protein